jgi:LPXTG-motif cell wall-anchored protein
VSLANTGAPIAGGIVGAVMALAGAIGLRLRRRR